MHTVEDGGRPEGGQDRDVDLLIEKGFLLLGSIEFQIDEHLMSHGTRIDPETRFFMAQVRDAAGDAAARLLDEARSRLDAAPAEPAVLDAGPEVIDAAAPVLQLPQRIEVILPPARRGAARRSRRGVGRVALGLGTAAAAVCAALLLAPGSSGLAPKKVGVASDDKLAAAAPSPPPRETEPRTPQAVTPARAVAAPRAPGPARHPGFRRVAAYASGPMIWSEDALHRLVVARRASLATAAAAGAQPPYPDPRARPEEAFAAASRPAAEAALALSRASRVEVQRRLALAEFDPQLFDGIFGPATRAALGAWQSAAGLTPTGYLDRPALALLRERTESDYRDWKTKQARAARRNARTVQTSPLPPASPPRPEGCDRAETGKIVYGRGVRCDLRGLRENIRRLFG